MTRLNTFACLLLTMAGIFALVIIDHMQTSYPYGYGAEMTCTGMCYNTEILAQNPVLYNDAGICREALDD